MVGAVRQSYRLVKTQYHVPEDGHDRHTFGNQVWRFIFKRIRDYLRAEGSSHGLTRHEARRVFWLNSNGTILASYRLPEAESKWEESFPLNNIGAGLLTQMNLRLQVELFDQSEPTGLPAALVLAHTGNPDEGCTGVYLMEPTAEDQGRIVEWGYTERLWAPGQDIGDLPQPVPVGPVLLPPRALPAIEQKET